jgi:hypothetical protein
MEGLTTSCLLRGLGLRDCFLHGRLHFSIIGAMRDCMIDIDFCITKGIFSTNATPAGLS